MEWLSKIYKIREDPDDAQSDVLLEHRLHISGAAGIGNNITWTVNSFTFIQPGGGSWTEDSPSPTSWVVTHADAQNPVAADFDSPPTMSGEADKDGGGDALKYTFTPASCDAPEGAMFNGDVVCAQYNYVAGTTTIAEEDEDEPAETEFEDDPD